jgi:hypothetical protein
VHLVFYQQSKQMPGRAAAKQQAAAKPEAIKPIEIVEDDDGDLLAAIREEYKPAAKAEQPKAEPKKEERTNIFAIGQYVEKLKEYICGKSDGAISYKDIKQFDVFVFTDDRTLLRSETSKAGKSYQRHIVQPLNVVVVFFEGERQTITRLNLIKLFGTHYLSLFYSQYFTIKKDFKINIAAIDATPKVRGDYADYGYKFILVDDKKPVSVKLAEKYASLTPPVVQEYKPKRFVELDYSNYDVSQLDDDCV